MDEDANLDTSEHQSQTYLLLKTGELCVRNPDGSFRCPFCPNRKKQDYLYNEILNHAAGVEASPARSIDDSSSHRALATFLRSDVPKPPTSKEKDKNPNPDADGCNTDGPERDDRFVYPWTGLLGNLPVNVDLTSGRRVGESGSRMKEELSRFNPVRVRPVWSFLGHSGSALVEFTQDWKGFRDALMFHRFFEANGFGRKDWEKKSHGVRDMFGWIARAEDFNSDGPVGQQMRKNRELTTIAEVSAGAVRKRERLVEKLEERIDEKDRYVEELKVKYGENFLFYGKMMEEKTKILDKYNEEVLKMRSRASDHSRVVVADNAKLKSDLEAKRKQLDALANDHVQLKQMTALQNATLEQEKNDECVEKLLKTQQMEKEVALNKLLQLKKQLDAKQKLELEIQQLKDKVQVMTHMGGKEDAGLKEKIFEFNEELKVKIEEMEDLDAMNQTLLVKENRAKEELQDARKMLIEVLPKMVKSAANSKIQVKVMGELDKKPFELACKQRFPKEDHDRMVERIYSTWQEKIKNVEWNPYKNVILNGRAQEVIDEEDAELKVMKSDLGDEAYKSVCAALLEMKNNGSRDVVPEFWSKDGRKATMNEAIRFFLEKWNGKISH